MLASFVVKCYLSFKESLQLSLNNVNASLIENACSNTFKLSLEMETAKSNA